MLFNVEKCKVMHIGFDKMKAEYLMDGVKLEHVKVEKVRSSAFFVTVRAGTAYWKI